MPAARIAVLTLLSLLAFAGNSLLCRIALHETTIDPASFTTIRVASGALTLWIIARWFRPHRTGRGTWRSAAALCGYAIAFSYAYVHLPAGTGALLLFGAVQATMIGHGVWTGERMRPVQVAGFVLAMVGLVSLLLPGITAPPLISSALMIFAGMSWGVYSLRGRREGDPIRVTAGNFLRAVPIALAMSLIMYPSASVDATGFWYAVASGALTSGIGYSMWYAVLPLLRATDAATVQLSVPVIAAAGGILLLGESLSLRLVLASTAIIGGIAIVLRNKSAG